jgi:hypothetical protein
MFRETLAHNRAAFGTVALAVVMAAAVLMATPGAADVAADKATLQHIRQVTGRYHSLTQAEKAGYVATPVCVASPAGGMGYHYFNEADLLDTTLDVDRPEALLYASTQNGGRRLVAVEYVVVDADQNLATTDDRPVLAGHPFEGPMPGHHPGMPVHYDLHVWAWADNPSGTFAPWNPAITCP